MCAQKSLKVKTAISLSADPVREVRPTLNSVAWSRHNRHMIIEKRQIGEISDLIEGVVAELFQPEFNQLFSISIVPIVQSLLYEKNIIFITEATAHIISA